jgi:hypothetical protein
LITVENVRAAALRLRSSSERPAPRGGHPQFMTNGKCFAELPSGDPATVRTWHDGAWLVADLHETDPVDLDAKLLAAWRQRAKKMDVAALDYAKGREDLAEVFAELRSWPELTERRVGDFQAGGRAFLHFHHSETSRHADVKRGLGWGDPIPFPLGRPSPAVVSGFLTEVRDRLATTLAAIAAAKRR